MVNSEFEIFSNYLILMFKEEVVQQQINDSQRIYIHRYMNDFSKVLFYRCKRFSIHLRASDVYDYRDTSVLMSPDSWSASYFFGHTL